MPVRDTLGEQPLVFVPRLGEDLTDHPIVPVQDFIGQRSGRFEHDGDQRRVALLAVFFQLIDRSLRTFPPSADLIDGGANQHNPLDRLRREWHESGIVTVGSVGWATYIRAQRA